MSDLTTSAKTTNTPPSAAESFGLTNPVLWLSGGFIALFISLALYDSVLLSSLINTGFAWSIKIFGPYWQALLLLTFIIGLFLAITHTGNVKLGGLEKPEIHSFQWLTILLCTLLAGGGVFWAAAEPIAHYLTAPPLYGETTSLWQRAINALAQSFMHWGFLAWAITGCLTSIVLSHLHYDKGLPLQPRTLLYPLLGERALHGPIGAIIDACCVIAVAAGTIGPIGFLGLQISFALNSLVGIPDGFTTQFIVILFAIAIYTLSALSGLDRGIQILSRWNIILAVGLMVYILVIGPTGFIISGYLQGVGTMLNNLIPMATYRGNEEWLSWWTVFFWGWFIGYGPMMSIFVTRISRGRTIRQLILTLSICAPMVTCFWFTIVGGTGIAFEIADLGSVSKAFEGSTINFPAALLAITNQLPFPTLISILFLILTTIFIVTTGDSMTYTISVVISGTTEPNALIRAFWGVVMGVTAIILISLGEGGVSALQSFIVITAVPVSLILLPSLWDAPRIAMQMAKNQGRK